MSLYVYTCRKWHFAQLFNSAVKAFGNSEKMDPLFCEDAEAQEPLQLLSLTYRYLKPYSRNLRQKRRLGQRKNIERNRHNWLCSPMSCW